MKALYSSFKTTQSTVANSLVNTVLRHAKTPYLRPIPKHQQEALSLLLSFVKQEDRPIVIDSCCGTGLSTALLAERFPDHFVVGIDKSIARLSRSPALSSSNYILIRGDVIDLWRLLSQENLPITHHFLFFPNPWPKATQLKRRFHAHPVFSTMAKLAPYFEMRTNWDIYALECQEALGTLGLKASLEIKKDQSYISLFEKKYQAASCSIYVVKLDQTNH